ncbi:MAG: DUF1566 domain-containing protein [Thiohalomonadales bacterium]
MITYCHFVTTLQIAIWLSCYHITIASASPQEGTFNLNTLVDSRKSMQALVESRFKSSAKDTDSCELHPFKGPRYLKLDRQGIALADQQSRLIGAAWSCVLDQRTQLVWEVKTAQPGLHDRDNRYTWFNSNTHTNGGSAGHAQQGFCQDSACDTASYISALNAESYCSSNQWRLPNREELRSLVRYDIPYPGPTLDRDFFPNTVAQYYWSVSPASDDIDSAWGIGFSFGFDYAYFKSHAAYVRAVYSKP